MTEIDSEGKTEYTFEKLTQKNVVSRLWGEVYPCVIYDAFSKGPVETSRTVYKSSPSGYTAVEKTENFYTLKNDYDHGPIDNFTVKRKCLYLYPSDYAPDFGPEKYKVLRLMGWQYEKGEYPSSEFNDARIVDRDEMEWFEGIDYSIEPCSEQLVGKKVTYYFDNLQSCHLYTYDASDEYLLG